MDLSHLSFPKDQDSKFRSASSGKDWSHFSFPEHSFTDPTYLGILEESGVQVAGERPREFGTSYDPERGQVSREKASRTLVRRLKKEFKRQGRFEEFEEFAKLGGDYPLGSETLAAVDQSMEKEVLPAVFDLLSIGSYPTTGGVDEYLRTGNAWEGFKQASIEFATALPGIELEGARKLSFSETDLPRIIFGEDYGTGRWSAPAIGFIMDVLLDPINLLGVGAVKGGIMGIGRGVEALSPAVGRAARRSATAIHQSKRAQKLRESFIHEDFRIANEMEKSLGVEGRIAGEAYVELKDKTLEATTRMEVGLHDHFSRLFAHLAPRERALLGMIADQPQKLRQVVETMTERGTLTLEKADEVIDMANYLHGTGKRSIVTGKVNADGLMTKLFKSGERNGLWDEVQFRDHHIHGMEPISPGSGRVSGKVQAERGIEPARATDEQIDQIITDGGIPSSARHRKTKNSIDRLEAGYDTEFDIANIVYKQTLEQARWTQTQKFIKAVIRDKRISAKIKDLNEDKTNLWENASEWNLLKKNLEEAKPGYSVLEIRKGKWDRRSKSFTDEDGDITAAYLMPTQMVESLGKQNQFFRDPGLMGEFWETAGKWTGVWRGYATLSTGFHLRNFHSLMFNNWLAGVGMEKGKMLRGGKLDKAQLTPLLMRHLQAFKLQMYGRGTSVANRGRSTRRAAGGSILPDHVNQSLAKLGFKSLDEVSFPKIRWHKGTRKAGQVMTPDELIRVGRQQGVPQMGSKIDNHPQNFEKELLGREGLLEKPFSDAERRAFGSEAAADIVERTGQPDLIGRAKDLAGKQMEDFGAGAIRGVKGDAGFVTMNRAFGSAIENNGRWALFLDRLEKGSSAQDARRAISTWHYDYRKLTDFEKQYMRVLIPFYAWQRFNIPRMMNAVLDNPAKVSRLPKFLEAVNNTNLYRLQEEEEPDYFEHIVHAQLPFTRNGKPLYTTPDLPINDLGRLNYKDQLSSMNPFVKVLFEDVPTGGSNFFTGASLENYPGEVDSELGVSRRQMHVIGSLVPPAGRLARSLKASDRGELAEFLASEFTGLKIRAIDVRRTTRGAQYREEQIARQFKKKLTDERRAARKALKESKE
jgi:hypothetical protein